MVIQISKGLVVPATLEGAWRALRPPGAAINDYPVSPGRLLELTDGVGAAG